MRGMFYRPALHFIRLPARPETWVWFGTVGGPWFCRGLGVTIFGRAYVVDFTLPHRRYGDIYAPVRQHESRTLLRINRAAT